MKVQEIYENVIALTLEIPEEDTEFKEYVVPHFNLLLQELFVRNNIARQRNGKEPLAILPKIKTTEDENPFEWQFDAALIYGLAAKLFTAGENELANAYQQMYFNAVNGALPAEAEKVEDYYAADYY